MQLTLKRPKRTEAPFTISDLFIDGVFFCHVLEDTDRGLYKTDELWYIKSIKVKHETAIPYGEYQIVMSFSNRFQVYLPELLDVPGYSGIRIHAGNSEIDTSGCLLPGIRKGNKVLQSKATTTTLISLIKKRSKTEKVFINILPSSEEN